MAGVDHQPFVIRLVDQTLKKFLPDARIAPSDKATMRIAPSAISRRQVAPGRTGPQNPEHRIDKQAVILGHAAPGAFAPRQMRLQPLQVSSERS
ncbi:MAG: hypothetical protein OJF51_003643 [Nitrospira sp.]|nr:MAG: hypothetical protein OJF51_003643 [Nitrospira sp.]